MARPAGLSLATLTLCLLSLSRVTDAQTASRDPAARGLDVFVHAPPLAAPGALLPLDVEAFGFPTVASLVPLPGANIEATWNPEKMGVAGSRAPSPVKATADASGRAHLDVPMPEGEAGPLELLVGIRMGAHSRTRAVEIARARSSDVQIHVSDARVVPGSAITAWVFVTSAATGEPLPRAPVDLALLEGGVSRFEAQLVTDPAGNATARVPIPRSDEAVWSWTLEARAGLGARSQVARLKLVPREETPAMPVLSASFQQASVLAGDKADYVVRVRDAADRPVADLLVRTWIGPRGTEPPKDDKEWIKVSTASTTNAAGEVTGRVDTPSTVVRGVGSSVRLFVRTNVDGHDLAKEASVSVDHSTATAELLPEASSIVPGVEQRLLLRVRDGQGRPVAAPFLVEGDGLKADAETDGFGAAEVIWKAPADVGAARNVGPCAGGVAASVRVRPTALVPALAPRRAPFDLCVSVDREADALVRLDRTRARVGDKVHVQVMAAPSSGRGGGVGRAASNGPWSVIVRSQNGISAKSLWVDDGEKGVDIEIGEGEEGIWSISAASPNEKSRARVASAALLVVPKILPKLAAVVTGGRAAPGGAVEVDARLTDEHDRPLVGSIAALLIDAHGGGSTAGIEALDTRTRLCDPFVVEREHCNALVDGDPALEVARRAGLADHTVSPTAPLVDPGANVTEQLTRSFADVLLSLEGAVFEATATPDQLRDVRRKVGTGWRFNPELMTLVTAAMKTPPETPGGEPLVLDDLLAVDPQVTFDNVARRISRLKLFSVLAAVRAFRHEHQLDADEPALANPNAIVRRLVRDGQLTDQMLLDPWGGTIQFARSSGPPIPFLSAIRGFELRAPGPDGVLGTADDVRDPFARVLKSGSPYAKAVQEDRIVDAKFEMEVGDATVGAWRWMFEELTGTQVGEAFGSGGLGSSGVGEGGGGVGHGVGVGAFGGIGHGRGSLGIDSGVAFWASPARTDDQGRLRIRVPLGDIETTWRLALVAVPDGGAPATTAIDIPVALPLSVRVDAGARWIEGDEMSVAITVRNRSARPIAATVAVAASGAAQLTERGATNRAASAVDPLVRTVEAPVGGAVVTSVRVRATQPGTARLDVSVHAAGVPDDVVNHTWEVASAGELVDFATTSWIEGTAELVPALPLQSIRIVGAPRLVLERGFDLAVAGGLESLDPDGLSSPGALADAIEVAGRVRRWATARGGETDPLAQRAGEFARRATGRLAAYAALDASASRVAVARAQVWAPAGVVELLGKAAECPDLPAETLSERIDELEAEPPPTAGSSKVCWDAFVANTVDGATGSGDAVELARVVLALAERPHRAFLAGVLADRLRESVSLASSGAISLEGSLASRRPARSVVFSALLRSIRLGKKRATGADKLAPWVLVQRDAQGSYGSTEATRSVVRALLAEGRAPGESNRVTVEVGGAKRDVDVPPSAPVVIPLGPRTTKVEVRGHGVLARFEQAALRLWSHPPDESESSLHVEVTWPAEPHAGKSGVLRLLLRHALSRAMTVDLRVPLPPGVSLAEPVHDVRQLQGVLAVRRRLDASDQPTAVEIPVHFGLAGRATAPESVARVALEESPRAIAPARPLTVLP